MSSHRGDGVANPVPIPDLSSGLPTISRAEGNPALRNFVRGLIVEEFDGAEPSALTLDAVTTYVRMLDRQACPADGQQPSRVEMYVAHVRQAVRAALFALDAGDETLARLMLGSARGELGAIDERYGGAELSSERENIRAADLELGAIQEALDRSLRDVGVRITVWLANTPSWAEPVARKESQSLFNPRSRRLRR